MIENGIDNVDKQTSIINERRGDDRLTKDDNRRKR